jgi:CHRD domain-containing protein
MKHIFCYAVVGVMVASSPLMRAQGSKTYKARLSPVPVAAYTPTVVGSGSATATLTGSTMVIAGTFAGLNTPATTARIYKSPKPGLRGTPLFDLSVSGGTSGTLTGQFNLTPAQVQELAQGRYYVQLHSEKAAEGNLWGWLLSQEKK